jgi:uncharacterized protein
VRLVRAAECPRVPWRNGAGWTRVIAQDPRDADFDGFAWRVSLAQILADGPFSAFTGVERHLVLCEGDTMALTVDGVEHELHPTEVLPFAGESAVSCALPDGGPALALNVMVRRRVQVASVRIAYAVPDLLVAAPAHSAVLVVALTPWTTLGRRRLPLGRFDTVWLRAGSHTSISGDGPVAVITIAPASRSVPLARSVARGPPPP